MNDTEGEVPPKYTIEELKAYLAKHRINDGEYEIMSVVRSGQIIDEFPFLVDQPVIIT